MTSERSIKHTIEHPIKHPIKRWTVSVIVTLVVLLACSSWPAFAAPPGDPCSLLTKDQVNAVLGAQVGDSKRVAPTLCEWSVPGPPLSNTKKVTVTLQTPQAFAYAKAPAGHGITKTPVSGVGDDAVFGVTPGVAAVLTVKKGDVVFVVHVYGFPIEAGKALDDVEAKEKTLAMQVLSKL